MHLTVYEQSEIFYFAFVFGTFLGVYYDFYRLLRHLGFTSKVAVISQDLAFMSTSAILCFLFAQVTVNGHLRGFVLIGHLLGIFAYRYSIGMLSGFVFAFIRFVLSFIWKFINAITSRVSKFLHKRLLDLTSFYSGFLSLLKGKSKKIKKSDVN